MVKITKQYTNRESQSLDKYLQEIGKVELLKPRRKSIWPDASRRETRAALEKLTKANLRFVVSVRQAVSEPGPVARRSDQ